MFSLNLLSVGFTDMLLFGWQMTFISPPIIGVVAADVEATEERFECCQHVILTSAKHV